jgi:hypothetical protein
LMKGVLDEEDEALIKESIMEVKQKPKNEG